MKDIKVQKIKIKKVEMPVQAESSVSQISTKSIKKEKIKLTPFVFFGLMSVSVFVYIFFLSSTFFYAIKEREVVMNTEKIAKSENINIVEENKKFLTAQKERNNNISYINVNKDVDISFK